MNATLFDQRINKSSNVTSDTVYDKIPNSNYFIFGEQTEFGQKCFMHHRKGNKDTRPQLCRVGKDRTSPPTYFLFGDSYSVVMSNVFNDFEAPGLFAAFNGLRCPTFIRPNMNSTPTRTDDAGS